MTTILAFHVAIALSSVAFATYLWVRPSKRKLYASYALAGLTLSSGTYLVLSARSHMLEACMMGIVYFAIISTATVAAHRALTANQ